MTPRLLVFFLFYGLNRFVVGVFYIIGGGGGIYVFSYWWGTIRLYLVMLTVEVIDTV